MRKGIESLPIIQHIFNGALIWFGGWFIFVVIEVILRLIKDSSPWPFMILFTLLLYSGVGIAGGSVLGGIIALFLKVFKRWQHRIEATPLIMSCCVVTIVFLYTSLFIHDRLLPLYPNLPRALVNLTFILFSLAILITCYITLARIVEKTKLIVSYLALSITIYTFMIAGLSINEDLLSGNFFQLDPVRIIANIGIVISNVALYLILDKIFIFIKNRADKTLKSIPLKTILAIATVLVLIGGAILYIGTRSTLKKPLVKPSGRTEDKPNIILITMDTTRADHLSCYGYNRDTTPYLDKLAKESVVFKNAYASAAWTLPSHASIFTGMYPSRHGAHRSTMSYHKLANHFTTLAEILAENGYKTSGVIGGPWCNSSFGLAQGFQDYNDDLVYILTDLRHFALYQILNRFFSLEDIAIRNGLDACRVASQINNIVFPWLEKNRHPPFFLFINYFDPHRPYLPPRQYLPFKEGAKPEVKESKKQQKRRELIPRYNGEIAYLDYHLGKLFERLKELKLYGNTMIVITSDHGEFFGEHDYWAHAKELYEEVIKVPLVIKYPSRYPKSGVFQKRVSLVDIMPTILNLLRLPIPKGVQGVDLFEGESRVMAEIYKHRVAKRRLGKEFSRGLQSLYLGNYKYIREVNGQGELYDIVKDPRELHNLIDIMPKMAEKMALKIVEWLPSEDFQASGKETIEFDKATKEKLRALGYMP